MNFIADEFSYKENITLDNFNEKLSELDKQLEICQREVSSCLENVQEKLEEQPKRNKTHISQVDKMKGEFTSLELTLSEISTTELPLANTTYKDLVKDVEALNFSISMVHNICEIHERIILLKNICSNYSGFETAIEIVDLLKVLNKTLNEYSGIPFIKELMKNVNAEVENVKSLFKKEFKNNCVFSCEKQIFIKVPKDVQILKYLFPAIYKDNSTKELIKLLIDFIFDKLFLTVIKHKCEINEKCIDNFEMLEIKIINIEDCDEYTIVYQNIILIVDFIIKYLDCKLDHNLSLISLISSSIKSNLAETTLKECILKSIPTDWKALDEFKANLIEATKKLEEKLSSIDMFDKKWNGINRIDYFYRQNRCKYFSDQSREILKKDLHNMVEVGKPYNSSKSIIETEEFFSCSISTNVLELIKLGDELIKEISEGPSKNRKELFSTYKGIFFNYGDFVAAYHQKLLETIPQQVALFYNNCRYLFIQLRDWNEIFESNDIFNEYCDDSSKAFHQVEEVGRMFFHSFVDEQKKQIDLILKETYLHNKKTLDKLEPNTEKLIRQCLRQQELLKTVWSKVLSYPTYNQTIGEILNSMCNYFISALVSIEDIEARMAENILDIFKIVLNRGPKLFTEPNEITLYVSQWHKYNELIFVLGASLLDINDRWSDGKGPLALEFKPYELKQLIRALFQNTERRAAVLAKIHE